MWPRCPKRFLTDIIGQFIASCPVSDFIGHCVISRTGRARCESTTPLRYEFVTPTPKKTCLKGPVTGNIPEVLDNGEVTDGTHVTAGQLALALTPYAQVTDLAVNTAASGNDAAAPGRPSHRRAGLKAGQQRAGAGDCAPSNGGSPGHHGRAGGRARKQHRRAAELADHGTRQTSRPSTCWRH